MFEYKTIRGPMQMVLEVTIHLGCSINETVVEAIDLSDQLKVPVRFDFNTVTVTVEGDSDTRLILRDFERALEGCIDKAVGPHPSAELTGDEAAHDAKIRAQNAGRREEERERVRRADRAKREAVEAKLAELPDMEIGDAEAWENYGDQKAKGAMSAAVIEYAERWARLMQAEMADGKALEDIAEATSYEANIDSITGAMYGLAVEVLARAWQHGEQLRRWHNRRYQHSDEGEAANETGGVLNPALLRIAAE